MGMPECVITPRGNFQTSGCTILAPLGCGIQTRAGAVLNSFAMPVGATIAVVGTGAVGLAAVMAAQVAGGVADRRL